MVLASSSNEGDEGALFTTTFLFALFANTAFALVFYLLVTAMAMYALDEFSTGETGAGLAASSFVIGSLASRVFAGRYVDVIGRRRVVIGALVLYVVCSLLYLAVDSFSLLVLLRMVHGMGFGFGSNALSSIVFDAVPPQKRGQGAGLFSMAYSLLPAAGPVLTIGLVSEWGYNAVFVMSAVISAFGLVSAFGLRREAATEPRTLREETDGLLRLAGILDFRVMGPALVLFLTGGVYSAVLTFMTGFALLHDMPAAAGGYFALYAGFSVISRLILGRVQDRYNDNLAIYPALVAYASSLALLAFFPVPVGLLVSGALAGFGFGCMYPLIQSICVSLVSRERLPIALSTFFIGMDLGFGTGPILLGAVLNSMGYQFMYLVSTATVLISIFLYWAVHGRRAGRGSRK